jgi:hypothetical protein
VFSVATNLDSAVLRVKLNLKGPSQKSARGKKQLEPQSFNLDPNYKKTSTLIIG